MNGMSGGMMGGMALIWVLAVIVLALIAIALVKYVFFSNRKWSRSAARHWSGRGLAVPAGLDANEPASWPPMHLRVEGTISR